MISFACPTCQKTLTVDAGAADDDVPVDVALARTYKRPGLAAALSLVPGFGQFYNGQIGKGILFIFFQVALVAMIVVGFQRTLYAIPLLILGVVSCLVVL